MADFCWGCLAGGMFPEHPERNDLAGVVDAGQYMVVLCEGCGWITVDHQGRERSRAAQALAEFHEHPNALHEGTNTQALRRTLHQEEHDELMHELEEAAAGRADLRQIARELADVVYVAYGSAWAFGIDLDAALREIHRAAMDKMEAGVRREDGKILKPPGFRPPDMTAAVVPASAGTQEPSA